MSKSRVETPPTDDLGLLQQLLTTQPPSQSRIGRSKQLRSLNQQRSIALKGYRFRGLFDIFLVHTERILFLFVIGFFGFWLYNGYIQDWIYSLRHQPAVQVAWSQIQPGASAAELDAALGQNLPYVPNIGAPPARPPDYLVPAQAFVLPPVPTPEPADPRPVRMLVPKMQLDSPVKEVFLQAGVWEVADYAVGYHHGTAMPGTGNTVMAGHAGFRGGVFARLGELAIGDDVYLETAQTRFHYQVAQVFSVWPNQVEVMYPTEDVQVTMITCTAWDTQRLIVIAKLVDQAPLSSNVGGGESRGSS